MPKKIYTYLLLLINTVTFSQNLKNSAAKVDSNFYYVETANYHKNNKVFDRALESANKSVLYSKKVNNNFGIANGYFTLATIYIDLKKYDDAIEKLIRAVSILNEQAPSSKLALSYYNLGICYLHKDKADRAESYFEKANTIYESINLGDAKQTINLQKGLIYVEKKQFVEAEKAFTEIAHLQKSKDTYNLQSEALYQLGTLKLNQSANNLALEYLKRGYDLSIEEKNISHQLKISKKLSDAYYNLKDNANSLNFLKIHNKLKDSIMFVNEPKTIVINEQKKIDKIMLEMEKMDKVKKQQEKAGKFSKLINILSIALITILSLLSLSLYKNNIIRNKSNELLREKNNELEIAKERIETASKARAEFLSTVSHELRTPLNAINGISHILLEDNPKKDQIEYLKSLKFSGNYLLTYINEILEINRIESNNIEIESISFNIRELMNNIQNSLKEQASINNNDFYLNIDSRVPEILIGDPTKLSQIFINLINNALKFTKNGTVNVNANTIIANEGNCNIQFEIKDTGIGIALDKQESIFESFSQGSVEINRKYGGTGLGLTIVKKLISLMGGNIKLKSDIGIGSVFSFALDFNIGEEIAISTENNIIDENIFVNKMILLVEDNKINQMITKKILEKKSMVCDISETGEDAIEKMKTNDYDLVLMDVHLPGINGTIATQEIRKFDSITPIIALTAISLNENREMLMSYGMTDVITKPFNPDVFYKTIEQNFLTTNIDESIL
jgi:signal transduction histidine kinase/CheY-like chemotaxis protein